MIVHETRAGDYIGRTAAEMVATADRCKDTVTAKFNDVPLTARPGDTADAVVAAYWTESERQAEAYRNSDEGRKAASEREAAQRRNAERVGEMGEFPLHAALTMTTGRVWGDFGEAHRLAEWVLGRSVWTHEFAYGAGETVKRAILAARPDLDAVTEAECPTSPADVGERLAAQVARFGETVSLPRGGGA